MNLSKLQAIREAVIKAVPEILELKFGCEIFREGAQKKEFICGMFSDKVALVRVDELGTWMPFEIPMPPASQEWIVIGRPIRLADVMIAWAKRRADLVASPSFQKEGLCCLVPAPGCECPIAPGYTYWNLRKDSLEDQSEETIEFLYKLLK